jgi:hypothetical protein
MAIVWLVLLSLGVFLITRAWFWCFVFFLVALSSGFAMLASIIHFQILGAVGFFFLMAIGWSALSWLYEKKYA